MPGSEYHRAVNTEGKNQVLKEQQAQRRYNDDTAEEVALIGSSVFKGFGVALLDQQARNDHEMENSSLITL